MAIIPLVLPALQTIHSHVYEEACPGPRVFAVSWDEHVSKADARRCPSYVATQFYELEQPESP